MIDPFKKITENDKIELLKTLEASIYDFDKNTSILSTTKINDSLCIVLEGYLQIIKTDYNGNKTIVEDLLQYSLFSPSLSFFNDDECDIMAKEPSKIILIDDHAIFNPSLTSPSYTQFILNLLEITTLIIKQRNTRINILTQKSIRNKLLEYFNQMANQQRSRIIYLPFSFTDLADYLAIDRSAMSREIKHLKEEKIIDVKARKIMLNYR